MAGHAGVGWFDERVRPLVRYPTGGGSEWVPMERVVEAAALERIEEHQRRGAGAPAKVALTTAAGWTAGYVTAALAVGVLRDGVLVRLGADPGAAALRDAGGWLCDLRLGPQAVVAVAADHPLAGEPGVEVVDDPAAALGAEVARVCGPWIDAIATRSRRGRNGLWAMAADAIGTATSTVAAADPERPLTEWVAAAQDLLARPGSPWRHQPKLWITGADADGSPRVVQHRSSCCLWYRCDPDLADDPPTARAAKEEEPNYCSTCLFREPADIEARVRAG